MTSHAAIVSRELGVPAVVGAEDATQKLRDGETVTLDGDKGTVEKGAKVPETTGEEEDAGPVEAHSPVKPMTGTEVKVNVSIPEAAERAAATGADGVGLLRIEHMILSTDKTPSRYVEDHGERAYVDEIVEGVRSVAEAFYPRPVRVRTSMPHPTSSASSRAAKTSRASTTRCSAIGASGARLTDPASSSSNSGRSSACTTSATTTSN